MSLAIGLSTIVLGQTPAAQGTAPGSGTRYVAIGCIMRQGTNASPRYFVTDSRDGKSRYRLEGDAALLAQHVGHTVEVSGPLSGPSNGTLRVRSLVWIASSCKK